MRKEKSRPVTNIDSFLHNAPRIAGVITGGLSLASIRKAVKLGADMIEVRVDTFTRQERNPARLAAVLAKIRSDKSVGRLPILLTIRSVKEGGKARVDDAERLELFTMLMPFADLVDIELSSGRLLKDVVRLKKKAGTGLIASYHNFTSTPGLSALRRIIKKGRAAGADYVKIAACAPERASLRRLAGLLVEDNGLIVIGMGAFAAPSRVFFPLLGSLVTYGSVTAATAPGQMNVAGIRKGFKLCGI
ncbi:MAG: type I 3-dehydroquinate dehydratase [Deltaproteobacteria bacterium]|nr:type I 3-dehydroquinate dehydratase [Deltaproteobacteria bacterium]